MTKLQQVVLLALTTFVLLALGRDARACQCAERVSPPCAEYWKAKVVFEAQVTEINPSSNEQGFYPEGTRVTLSVGKVCRGTINKLVFDVQGNGADCRVVYENGKQYLVYAFDYSTSAKTIVTSACSRTRQLSRAGEDLEYIRNLSQGQSESSIQGKVLAGYEPLEGIRIEVEGLGKRYDAVTDHDGNFAFRLAEAGRYKVRAVGPEKSGFLTYRRDGHWFTLEGRPVLEFEERVEGGGCAYVEFSLFIERVRRQ
jgi:hypothetical protein